MNDTMKEMEDYALTPRGIVFSIIQNIDVSKSIDKDMCEYLRRHNLCVIEDRGKLSFVTDEYLNKNISIDTLANEVDELQKKHWGLRMKIHEQKKKINRLIGIESVINFFTKNSNNEI